MFDTTAREWIASMTEKQDMPACLPLVSFTGGEGAAMFEIPQEFKTQVYLNDLGGITVSQPDEECGHCGRSETILVSFGSSRAREVAAEMMRLSDEIDAGRDVDE